MDRVLKKQQSMLLVRDSTTGGLTVSFAVAY